MFLNGTSVSANEVRSGFIQEVNEVVVTVNGVDYHFDKDSQSKNDFNRTDLQVGYRITISSNGEEQKKIIWYMASIPKDINTNQIKSLPVSQVDVVVKAVQSRWRAEAVQSGWRDLSPSDLDDLQSRREEALDQLRTLKNITDQFEGKKEIETDLKTKIRELESKYNKALKILDSRNLDFSGLTFITKETAAKLAKYSCYKLTLNGLPEITPDIAEALGQSRASQLHLNGVKALDLEAGQSLAKFKGNRIELKSLLAVNYDILTALTKFAAKTDSREIFPLKQKVVLTEFLEKALGRWIPDVNKNIDVEILNILLQWKPWPPNLRDYLGYVSKEELLPKTLELIAENFRFNATVLRNNPTDELDVLRLKFRSITPEFADQLNDSKCYVELVLNSISPPVAARLPENIFFLVVHEIDLKTASILAKRRFKFRRLTVGDGFSTNINLTPQLCAALSQIPTDKLWLRFCEPFNSDVAHELSEFDGDTLSFPSRFYEVIPKDVIRILENNSKAQRLENLAFREDIIPKPVVARKLRMENEKAAVAKAEEVKRNEAVIGLSWGFNEEDIEKLYGKTMITKKNERVTTIDFKHEVLKKPYNVQCKLWDDQLIKVYVTAEYTTYRKYDSNRSEPWNPYEEFLSLRGTLEDKYGDTPAYTGRNFVFQTNSSGDRVPSTNLSYGESWCSHRPFYRQSMAEAAWRVGKKEVQLYAEMANANGKVRNYVTISYKELSKRREEFEKWSAEKRLIESETRRTTEAKESGL